MSLSSRIALIVTLVAAAFAVAGNLVQRRLVYEEFVAIERKAAIDDLRRCQDAVRTELAGLAVWCGDWAAWDDVVSFLEEGKGDFVSVNLTDESMQNTNVDAIWVVANDGAVRAFKGRHRETGAAITVPEVADGRFPLDHPLLRPRGLVEPVAGIVRTALGPMLIASRQVIHSDFTGPSAGWMIAGRILTPASFRAVAASTHVAFSAWDVGDATIDPRAEIVLDRASNEMATWVDDGSEETLSVFGHLDDLVGSPAVAFRADVPREISLQGAASLRFAAFVVGATGLAMVAVLIALLGFTVVGPLTRLRDHATQVGRNDDLSRRTGIDRSDEIGDLAKAFDAMVAHLAESRSQLSDAARRAGMADVARGVLHNVGNVLTSVNVTAVEIAGRIRESRASGMAKGIDLLREHSGDLPAFLTEDPRGRVLPEYLAQAGAALRAEHESLLDSAGRLQQGVAHAAEIVARQGEFTSAPALAERVSLATLLSGAATLVEPALRRHGVTLVREAEPDATVTVDRGRLTQVLVNLLTNAKESLAAAPAADRRIRVHAEVRGARVVITVADNGCGIGAEDVERLFQTGFSTKARGRGFGLHFCRVTLREMGGDIRAESAGPGTGSTFTVDLPARPGAPSRAAEPTLVGGAA